MESGSFGFPVPSQPNPLFPSSEETFQPNLSHMQGVSSWKSKTLANTGDFYFFPPKKTQGFPRKSSISMKTAAGGQRSVKAK